LRGIVFDGNELRVRDGLEVREPGPGEVRVRIVRAGVCQSDVSVLKGAIPYPTPVVLGHEGAGVVEALGPGVSAPLAGSHVVLSTLGQCGACPACDSGRPTLCRSTFGERPTPFSLDGEPHYSFANVSSFAEHIVVKANQAIPIPASVPMAAASLIGCAVLTGTGAVWNRARVQPGESVAVVGVGGIGLNVIQAAALSGAQPIVAVDNDASKRELALAFGATHFVDTTVGDFATETKRLTGGWGANHVFECVGAKELIEQALGCVDWGGNIVILGVPAAGESVEFLPMATYLDVSIMGCRYGSARPFADVERISRFYQAGKLKLDELVSREYPLEEIHQLLADMREGRLARGVLEVGAP
jgi:S-(hydroxymethyl)glutathione dehydrogenase/alcohol dehydrogenase